MTKDKDYETGFEKVELIGENGEKEEFVVDAMFEYNEREYIILSKEGADEALMLRVKYDSEREPMFVQIEDDSEFEGALQAYDEIIMEHQ